MSTEHPKKIGPVESDSIQLIQSPSVSDQSRRIGAVETPVLEKSPDAIFESPTLHDMRVRLRESTRTALRNDRRGLVHLERDLTALLTQIADEYLLRALMIASEDGLVIAKASNQGLEQTQEDALAAFSALCNGVGERAVRDSLLDSVDEITLRAPDRAHISIRSLRVGPMRLLLIAATRAHSPAKFVTDQALAQCGALLSEFYAADPASSGLEADTQSQGAWRRFFHRTLAQIQNSGFFE